MIEYNYDVIQNTDDWIEARRGLITSSVIKLLITPKFALANNEKKRMIEYELAAQRHTCFVEPVYETFDMQRGHTEEVYAKDLYSKTYDQVKDCGFIVNKSLGFDVGFSPDGLIGDDGMIEVKSRKQKLQFKTHTEKVVPPEFMAQIQTGLFVSGRKWCDFVSYSNGMALFIKRVFPNEEQQEVIKKAIKLSEKNIMDILESYRENTKGFPVADRRDVETGDEIKPSKNSEDLTDYSMAG